MSDEEIEMPSTGEFERELGRLAGLAGKRAVVVGGAGGVGRAVSMELWRLGVDLACCDIDADAVAALRKDLVTASDRVSMVEQVDALEPAALSRFYEGVAATFDEIDILVNVVGGVFRTWFTETTPDDWDGDISRNYRYVVQSVHEALDLMPSDGRGASIVNFTTIEAHRAAPRFAVYAGAKAAVTNFSRSLAVELGPQRIRVNCIAPDTTPSQTSRNAVPPEYAEQFLANPELYARGRVMYIPHGSPPPVEDLAHAVAFLASNLSGAITGQTLHVDGGTFASSGWINWPFGEGPMPSPPISTLERLFRGD